VESGLVEISPGVRMIKPIMSNLAQTTVKLNSRVLNARVPI
jgi:hypothetical protein